MAGDGGESTGSSGNAGGVFSTTGAGVGSRVFPGAVGLRVGESVMGTQSEEEVLPAVSVVWPRGQSRQPKPAALPP